MEITEIYSHLFDKKIRESNDFTKEVDKELISRNNFSLRVNFHSTLCVVLMFQQNFREN